MDYARGLDSSIAFLFIGGIPAGLIGTSRVLAWAVNVRTAWRDGTSRAWLVPLVAHSGPWVLALAIASTWLVGSKGHASWLAAWLGGLVLGPILIAFVVGSTRPVEAPTPERLAQKRREAYLIIGAASGIAAMMLGMCDQWATPSPNIAFIVVVTLGGTAGGLSTAAIMALLFGPAPAAEKKPRPPRAPKQSLDA